MQHDPPRLVYDFTAPPRVPPVELTRLLGGKGANLVVMANELGLPVPPGFTITTEACARYLAGAWPAELDEQLRAHIERLGRNVGRRFGDAADPLLVSVRSGAPVSMPGMLDTILNLGLNEDTARGLARGAAADDEFAADCLRRFREGYSAVTATREVPDDPWLQLRGAIEAVFDSWNGGRAQAYRRREGIPDELGTAVTVQAMVFGNRGAESGTGVLFTRNPATGEATPYGDVMFNAQGEDVVAGAQAPLPISALDERLPDVAAELRRHAQLLERRHADLCDIEFTIEQGRLWLLQVRVGKRSPQAALRMAIDMAEDDEFPLSRHDAVRRVAHLLADPPRIFIPAADAPPAIATGLPASPGLASGAVVTTSDAAESAAEAGQTVILVRPETSPEDVRGMARAAGVLTASGGLASHAAVVARGWGIPAVVGATGVSVAADAIRIDDRTIPVGDPITINGSSGEIHLGDVPGTWEVATEAAMLLGWAAELGLELDALTSAVSSATPERSDQRSGDRRRADDSQPGPATAEDALRALLVKGMATRAQLVEAVRVEEVELEQIIERLVTDRLAQDADAQVRLSSQGKLAALAAFTADRAELGPEVADRLLGEFHPLDIRMKKIVTAWQIRDVAGQQVLNDHADSDYDEAVLGRLAELHSEAAEWLAPFAAPLRRFGVYRTRLSAALALARAGDQRYVASPRVDSYHGVWFELHEDLIRLAGRRRAEEAAAGRA